MATKKKKRLTTSKVILALTAVLILLILFTNFNAILRGEFSLEAYFADLFGIAAPTPSVAQRGSGEMRIHFLDVGQGDSAFIELASGKTLLIDTGEYGYGNDIVKYIKALGYDAVDHLVLTHPHSDHIGGARPVLRGLTVGRVWMPDATNNNSSYVKTLELIDELNIPLSIAKAGDTIEPGLTVLSPAEDAAWKDLNDWSIVLLIKYLDYSFLFTGDATQNVEKTVSPGKINVLKVGHHGSHTSTGKDFIKALQPEYAVISLGAGNDYGYPHQETLEALEKVMVYRTDLSGTVICSCTEDGLSFSTEK